MDADFSHNPESLPVLLAKANTGYDLVVGSRYIPGGAVEGWPPSRKILSSAANLLAHLVLGVSIRDCTAGFRCYQRHVLECIDLDAIFSSGYSFLMEMAFHVQRAGFRCGEVPITFVNRTEGSSKSLLHPHPSAHQGPALGVGGGEVAAAEAGDDWVEGIRYWVLDIG